MILARKSLVLLLLPLIRTLYLLYLLQGVQALVAPAQTSGKCNDNASQVIRLVSWNLLAPRFGHPDKYSRTLPEHLCWSYREKLILRELERINADILCLQEMETEYFDGFMEHLQEKYEGILQNVTNDHPVTTAVLLRKGKLRVLRQESRSRALILVIEQQQQQQEQTGGGDEISSGRCHPLYLANVHLQAGMEDDETRISQLKSLLKRIQNHVRIEMPEPKGKAKLKQKQIPPPVILAGDFNMLRTNPVYQWLSHKHHGFASTTQQPQVSLRDTGTGLVHLDLKFPKNVPLLPLQDTYADRPPVLCVSSQQKQQQQQQSQQDNNDNDDVGHVLQKTYCGGSVLDYIWTTKSNNKQTSTADPSSSNIEIVQTMVFHPAAFSKERQQWPSKDHPSDHLPVGVDFIWR